MKNHKTRVFLVVLNTPLRHKTFSETESHLQQIGFIENSVLKDIRQRVHEAFVRQDAKSLTATLCRVPGTRRGFSEYVLGR